MNKRSLVLAAFASVFAASSASADLFVNNDTACESRAVLCTSVTGQTECADSAISIACRNITEGADFNGDGFGDCVMVGGYTNDAVAQNISILNNNGGNSVCGVGTGRFANAEDHALSGVVTNNNFDLTNIVAGSLNGGVTDIALAMTSYFDDGDLLAQVLIPAQSYGVDESTLNTTDVDWRTAQDQRSTPSYYGQRALRLLNCNADSNLDAVIVTESFPAESPSEVRINLLKNNGSGLQAPAASFFVTNFSGEGVSPTLAVADLDGDGDTDVAVAVPDNAEGINSKVVICRNDSACNYTCDTPIELNQVQDVNPYPSSIAAGDFDGDGDKDLAITTPGYGDINPGAGVAYFLNNGSGSFTAGPRAVLVTADSNKRPFALEAGCFNNDRSEDLAVTNLAELRPALVATVPQGSGEIKVLTMTGTLTPNVTTLAYDSEKIVNGNYGLDVGNFHDSLSGKYTNGDDIMAVGTEENLEAPESQRAFIFMNTAEVLSADAGVDRTIDLNESISLSGVCKLTPSDASDVIDAEWSVVGGNASNTVLQNGTSLSPTFHATAAGTYTVRLRCVTTCGRVIADDTVQIVVRGGLSTSGGCASNSLLSGVEGSSRLGGAFGMLMLSLALMFGVRSFQKNQ